MRFFTGFVSFALCLGLVHSFEDKSVYQYLVDNGYDRFVQLLQQAKVDTILNSAGPYTVFAPTNAAILNVDPGLMAQLTSQTQQLEQVMKYHASNGFILIPQIRGVNSITALEGQAIGVTLAGYTILLNNVSHVISPNDIICNNGVVHTIDTFMIPPLFGTNSITEVLLMRDDLFRDTFLAFLLADLSPLLESGEYTLFAPVDAAWAPYAESILHPNIPDSKAVYSEMLKYHMIPGARTIGMMQNGQQLFTLHGTAVNITKGVSRVVVNYAQIIHPDIPATNGIVHAIDGLLFPPDLLHRLQQEHAQGRK